MTESEFISSIDCCFPYDDEVRWRNLIECGATLSPNASFMVLHEICRPSRFANVSPDSQMQMLLYWKNCFKHPLSDLVSEAAKLLIEGRYQSVEQAINGMRLIGQYPDQYNALAIIHFSCGDNEERADTVYDEVIKGWKRRGSEQLTLQ